MRIAGVSMVKNECDIIELFARINTRVFDHLFVLDDGSTDTTTEILELLRHEGLPLTVWRCQTLGYEQASATLDAVRRVAALGAYDWIMPLDADEFVERATLRDELAQCGGCDCAKLLWRTYVPVSERFSELDAPLWSAFRARSFEPVAYGKVVLSAKVARRAVLQRGNHEAYHPSGRELQARVLATRLAHVPVRSSDQIVSKVLVGSHKYSLSRQRTEGQGAHWDDVAAQVRQAGYVADLALLRRLASNYAAPSDSSDCPLDEALRIGEPSDVLKYPQLARVDVIARLDQFAASLCHAMQKPPSRLSRLLDPALEVAARARRKLGRF
jgi:hypothetical protein